MKTILNIGFLFLCIFFIQPLGAQHISEADSNAMMEVFNKQEIAWNKADIPTFMEGYWHSDSLVFVGANGPTYGWDATFKRYQKRYPDKEAMGKLKFDILNFYPIEGASVLVIGKFHLSRSDGDLSGYFSLVWKKINGSWLIVSDHTSQEVPRTISE